jgi:hypothetical protein
VPSGGLPCPPVVGCNPIGQLAGDGARAVAASAARTTFDAFTAWVGDGASALLGRVGGLISRATEVELGSRAFSAQFALMEKVGALVVLPMLMVALIGAVIHRDSGRLVRAIGLHLPAAVLGSFVAVELTTLGLRLTDELCGMVGSTAGSDASTIFGHVGRAIAVLSGLGKPDVGGFLGLALALLVAVGALVIWVELLLRASAIYVAVFFLPVALAGLVWPVTARWSRRLVELLAALILSKFVIVAVLSLGLAMVAKGDGIDVALSGGALLLLAAFAPFVVLRMAPVVEAAAIAHLEGVERRPLARAAASGKQAASLLLAQVEAAGAAEAVSPVSATGAGIAASPTLGGELDRLTLAGPASRTGGDRTGAGGGSADDRGADDRRGDDRK